MLIFLLRIVIFVYLLLIFLLKGKIRCAILFFHTFKRLFVVLELFLIIKSDLFVYRNRRIGNVAISLQFRCVSLQFVLIYLHFTRIYLHFSAIYLQFDGFRHTLTTRTYLHYLKFETIHKKESTSFGRSTLSLSYHMQ